MKQAINDLKLYLKYCTNKRGKRCGEYRDAIKDCIDILEGGDIAFEKIKVRDLGKTKR